jgi:hypothetical protein
VVEVLYKYGRMNEYSEQLFTGSKLYFASPRELNDPFECSPQVFASDQSSEAYRRYLLKEIKKRGGTRAQARKHASGQIRSNVHRLDTTYDRVRADMKSAHDRAGLYFLSEVGDQILMWSHYGDGHRGYCIEFEATDSTLVFRCAQKVVYQDDYPAIDFSRRDKYKWAEAAVLTKYTDWSYEKEWRIVYPEKGLKDYPCGMMVSITFGAMMTEEYKAYVRQWSSLRPSRPRLKQAKIHGSRYALEIANLSS